MFLFLSSLAELSILISAGFEKYFVKISDHRDRKIFFTKAVIIYKYIDIIIYMFNMKGKRINIIIRRDKLILKSIFSTLKIYKSAIIK